MAPPQLSAAQRARLLFPSVRHIRFDKRPFYLRKLRLQDLLQFVDRLACLTGAMQRFAAKAKRIARAGELEEATSLSNSDDAPLGPSSPVQREPYDRMPLSSRLFPQDEKLLHTIIDRHYGEIPESRLC